MKPLPVVLPLACVVLGLGLYAVLRKPAAAPSPENRDTLLPVQDRPARPSPRPRLDDPEQSAPALSVVGLQPPGGHEEAIAEQLSRLDPAAEDWDSESATEAIGSQLQRIKSWIEAGAHDDSIADLAAEGFTASLLRPAPLAPVMDEAVFRVLRPDGAPDARRIESRPPGALREFTGAGSAPRIKFKITGISRLDDGWRTRVLVEYLHEINGVLEQRNATWLCEWSGARLRGITTVHYEEVRLRGNTPLFDDATRAAMREVASYPGQVLRGIDHFTARQSKLDEMNLYGHHGLAIGDVNGDGLDDLYVCDAGGLPNRLYVQRPDGTLEDRSAESRADWLESSSGALLVDLDNDGDQDLAVATVPLVLIAENDGTGRFTLKGGHAAVADALSLAAADYDLDGDLDLYVCGYNDAARADRFGYRGFESASPVPYHDANNGGRNALLENRGGFAFADVTAAAGLDENNARFSFAAAWEDHDNDGDPDLYVANDFGRNNLYRNDGGTFRDVAAQAGVEDSAAGMSADWSDCNRDGRMDLYVGNMFSAAGKRVAYQRKFTSRHDEATARGLQRMARGNTLFLGRDDGTFEDASEEAGVTMGRWAWGSRFADLNNDGWTDLVVANGFFTGQRPDDL